MKHVVHIFVTMHIIGIAFVNGDDSTVKYDICSHQCQYIINYTIVSLPHQMVEGSAGLGDGSHQ